MKHIKKLMEMYPIVSHDGDIMILDVDRSSDTLSSILNDLEERIIAFTNEIEIKLADIYNDSQEKISELFKKVHKLPLSSTPDTKAVSDITSEIYSAKSDTDDSLDKLLIYIKESLSENFNDDFIFLNSSTNIARYLGDIQEAIKVQELIKKRLKQLYELTRDIYCNAKLRIYELYLSILSQLENKFRSSSSIYNSSKTDNNTHTENYNNETDNVSKNNSSNRIPRTSLKLKKHLREQGFELHRHNGSHNIYKNKEGEVRLIPARGGNHVLAAKTAKKIYQGVQVANE